MLIVICCIRKRLVAASVCFHVGGGVGGTYLRERGRKLRDFLHSGESVCIPLQNCDSSQFLFCGHVKSNRIQSRD